MPLSDQDREWVQLTARELVYQVTKDVIAAHIKSCPHGKFLLTSKWFLIGFCLGPGVIGGGVGALTIKLLAGM